MSSFTNLDSGVVVSDIKQWAYCPRVFYYRVCLPHVRPVTYKMKAGEEEGEAEEVRESRRSLRLYGLKNGSREFGVDLFSMNLHVHGRVDLLITVQDTGELIPVDYKLSEKPSDHFKQQLAAYAVMLEEIHQKRVRRGFLYLIPMRRAVEVDIDERLRKRTMKTLAAMQHVLESEEMPPPASRVAKCTGCEFRRFCNDVL